MQFPSKRLTAIAFGLVLTACQATPPERNVDFDVATGTQKARQPTESDTCGVASHAWLVGQNRDRIPPAPAGAVVRIVCSTCAMTMDFNASRLNIVYDEKTKIVSKLSCG